MPFLGNKFFHTFRNINLIIIYVLCSIFRVMDKNRDGFISKMEMIESSPHLTTSQVDAVFRRNDGDADGKLSKEEFINMIRRNSRDRKMMRFRSTDSVKSLPGSPQQDRARSNTGSPPNTGGSCRRTTRSSSASAGGRRHSESPVQNAPR